MQPKPFVVVVGMDFSEWADRALCQAFMIASLHERAEVHVVCVVPGVDGGIGAAYSSHGGTSTAGFGVPEGVYECLQARVRTGWLAFAAQAESPVFWNADRLRSHVRIDSPASGIVRLAADVRANLIVLGSHGHSSGPRLALGSVAERTVSHATCPVLVVPRSTQPPS